MAFSAAGSSPVFDPPVPELMWKLALEAVADLARDLALPLAAQKWAQLAALVEQELLSLLEAPQDALEAWQQEHPPPGQMA